MTKFKENKKPAVQGRIEKLLIATGNKGKVKEIIPMLAGYAEEVISLKDLDDPIEVEETGKTFTENAILKAETLAKLTGLPVLADDSGLEVDALNCEPGVYSARFAGENASDKDNYEKLISLIKDIPEEKRTARFRCVMAFVCDGETHTFDGKIEGRIITTPEGESGFGYDPVFVPDGYTNSFAELGKEIKSGISHRSNALNKFIQYVKSV